MRETVCIHVGQCGNQIGNQFWNQLLHEHEKTPDDDEALSAFFRFAPQRNGTVAMKARALLIDMECGPLQETMKGPLGSLFDETQFVMDVYGSGNNFAQGHYMYGPQYREKFLEGVRRNAEHCDSLQTFLVTHSLGGGTGSGVGTYVVGMLSDEFPKICRLSTCVYPSENNDVVTSPYNVILATSELIEHADCVFPLDNTALFAFSQRERGGRKGEDTGAGAASVPAVRDKRKDRGFDAINGVAARMLCHLTSSARFHGQMNVDLNEVYTNLVPYPRLHFLVTALSLQQQQQAQHQQWGSAGAGGGGQQAGRHGARAALQRAFGDVLSERGQIAAALPVQRDPAAGLGAGGGTVTLASAFLARGRAEAVPLSDFLDCVTSAQRSLRFPSWNQNACKIGMCGTPSPGEHMSVLAVYNSTSFGSVLDREMKGFQRLFRKKAMLHHYTEYTTELAVSEAEAATAAVLQEYEHLERHGVISPEHRAQLRRRAPALGAGLGLGQGHAVHTLSSFADFSAAASRPVQLFPAF